MAYFKPMLGTFLQSGQGNAWQGWQQSLRGGQQPPPLPAGWEQRVSGEGLSKFENRRPYYVHPATGRSTWTHPALLDTDLQPGDFEKPWEAKVCPPASTPMPGVAVSGGGHVPPQFQQQPPPHFFQQNR